jgi:beta-glucosidase
VDIESLIKKLTLEEKVLLVSGEDFWTTVALPSIGLRKMTVSDGPSGVRGPLWDERRSQCNCDWGATQFSKIKCFERNA